MSRLTARGVDRVAPSKRRTRTSKTAAPPRRRAKPRKTSRGRRGSLFTRLQAVPWNIVVVLVFILSTGFGGGYYWVSGQAAVLIGETQQMFIAAADIEEDLACDRMYPSWLRISSLQTPPRASQF